MKTYIIEKMPLLFYETIKKNNLNNYFYENITDKKNVEIIIMRTKTNCDSYFIKNFPNLKMIIRAGTGYDNIDLEFAKSKNIIVTNTPIANANSAAEQTISFIFALIKNILEQKERVINSLWKKNLKYNWEFSDLKILIVGYGRIGKIVAEKTNFLGAKIKIVDPFVNNSPFQNCRYEDGLSWCNTLTFHCPLSKYTHNYFSVNSLKFLKNPIWLINASRGSVIQEKAIETGLKNKQLLGVALDVFSIEPWIIKNFAKNKNVILSPHSGAYTQKAKNRMALETLEIWKNYLFQNVIPNPIINYDSLTPYKDNL